MEERRGYVVRGRVQGVGFRWSTVQQARALGLQGSVWNRADGAVEVHARGPVQALDALAAWLERGPAAARVAEVEQVPAGPEAGAEGFGVRRHGG